MTDVIAHPIFSEINELRKQYRKYFGNRDRDFFVYDDGCEPSWPDGWIVMECNEGGAGNIAENISDRAVAELIANCLRFLAR